MSSDRAFRRSVDRAQKFTAEKLDRNAAPVRIRSRHLTDENDVLRHNAWDDVAMAPDEEAAAEALVGKQPIARAERNPRRSTHCARLLVKERGAARPV